MLTKNITIEKGKDFYFGLEINDWCCHIHRNAGSFRNCIGFPWGEVPLLIEKLKEALEEKNNLTDE